jgi:hypothetical protein
LEKTPFLASYRTLLGRLLIQLAADVALLMNKSEAIAVLHELNEAIKESVSVSCVSLDGSQVSHISTGGYQIKIKCELDSYSREIIKGIIKRHNLTMKEQDGYVLLRSFGD